MRCYFVCIVFCFGCFASILSAQESPHQVLQAFIDDIRSFWVPLNRDPQASYASRRAWTEDLIDTRFEFFQMSRSSLGTQWRRLTDEEQATYQVLFRQILVETVIDWLDEYDGQVFEIRSIRQARKNTEVRTRFEQLDGSIVKATWVTRNTGGVYLFHDVRVSGISLMADFRGKYQRILHDGGVEGLFESLREEIDRLQAQHK